MKTHDLQKIARAAALACLPAAASLLAPAAHAQSDPPQVVITGQGFKPLTRISSDAAAQPASVTVIDKRAIDGQTITTYGDLLRNAAGLNVVDYGQGLVAYGVQLRGFDEGHGRNIAVALDGMPLNITGSQHTNGYADQAQLIPELLDRVEIVRGPFSVLAGNHAVGGSIQYTTDAARSSSVKLTVDNFGRTRLLPIGSLALGPGRLLVALDVTAGSAYNHQSRLERGNLFTRYAVPVAGGMASLRFQAYDATAQSPGYLDKALVESGQRSERAALARGIGDAKTQQNLVANFRSDDADGTSGWGGGWSASAWLNNDIRKRWTFYDLTQPPGVDAVLGQERDHLHQAGLDVRKTTTTTLAGLPAQLLAGLQLNDERLAALQFKTDADHRPLSPSAARPDGVGVDRQVNTRTVALLLQGQVQPTPGLKLSAGVRHDDLQFDVRLHGRDDTFAAATAAGAPTTVTRSAAQWSPKLGLAISLLDRPDQRIELFANSARGLKSPYAFADYFGNTGVAGAPAVPDLSISALRSLEAGLQGTLRSAGAGAGAGPAQWRLSVWNTRQSREADRNAAGFLQSFKQTQRDGVDLEGSAAIGPARRVFANLGRVRARVQQPVTPGADRIPNVPETTAALGLDATLQAAGQPLSLSLVDHWTGASAITTDNSLRSRPFHRLTARAAAPLPGWVGSQLSLSLVAYSRLHEEPAFDFGGGVIGITPKPRLRATLGLQVAL